MLESIYQWIENIAFYMVIIVAIMQMVSGETYKKYIRFFSGMILILMLIHPMLNIFRIGEVQTNAYEEATDFIEEMLEEEADGTEMEKFIF